jgi:hypothetical protein
MHIVNLSSYHPLQKHTTYMNNFKCVETGKEFYIANWKSKIENGSPCYYERSPGWNPLRNPENGALLEKIEPAELNMTTVHTETAISK